VLSEVEFFKTLSEFLTTKAGAPIAVEADTDLLATGAIDSLTMVEVLTLVEELSGRPIGPDDLEPELFEQAGRLYSTFFRSDAVLEEG
jgi:acyl carrier protein